MNLEELKRKMEYHVEWLNGIGGNDKKRLDLRSADLRCVNLQNANLQYAILRFANLRGADLQYANLQEVDLQGADLRNINLRFANLQGADLRNIDMRNADLENINLQNVDLWYANLQNTNLCKANLQNSNLHQTNLQGAHLQNSNLQCAKFSLFKLLLIDWGTISDKLTLECMRWCAVFIGCDKIDKWVNGGNHPYKNVEKDLDFVFKKELWIPGKPEMDACELIHALCEEKNIIL